MEQDLFGQLISPEVHTDRKVTFRLEAPGARRSWFKGWPAVNPRAWASNASGVWEVTLEPLAPELYSYTFSVDGVVVTDPHNRHVEENGSRSRVSWKCPEIHRSRISSNVCRTVLSTITCICRRQPAASAVVYVYTRPAIVRRHRSRWPLLVLMHGYGDDESAWLEVGRADWIADNLIAQDKAAPMVIAMPYGHPLPLARSGTFDDYATRNEAAMEQDLLHDLLPLLAAQYRLKQDRLQRAIVGLSMGGGQSLTIGLSNLDRFAWIGGFSSAPPRGDVDGKFASLLQDVAATNDQVKLLWIGCGKDDFLL